MSQILIVGSLNMDLVIRTSRLPQLGETITGQGFSVIPGGKGANQAIAVAKLGGDTAMIGAVGEDDYGKAMLRHLSSQGVDCSGISTLSGNSGIAVITVAGGDNHIILDPGANGQTTPDLLLGHKQLFEQARYVVLQLEIPMETVVFAARLAKEQGAKVVLNPAPMKELPRELLAMTDLLIPNEHEAAELLQMPLDTPQAREEGVRRLMELGITQVIITLGKDGCLFNDGDQICRFGSFPVPVQDTTAAGDSFIGGLCVALCQGESIQQAVRFATGVSAVTVSRKGASVSLPTRQEAEQLLRQYQTDN
ncbi:MAG: ribokinase [Clostridia bacterium]|nr:ribokinase [Clostridia bacterium]